jgi:hypothetical protein
MRIYTPTASKAIEEAGQQDGWSPLPGCGRIGAAWRGPDHGAASCRKKSWPNRSTSGRGSGNSNVCDAGTGQFNASDQILSAFIVNGLR